MTTSDKPLLEVNELDIVYRTPEGNLNAVSEASFTVDGNEYFGLVGESGCGKSTLAHAVINGLDPNGAVSSGEIRYKGDDIYSMSEREFDNQLRWNEIALIPQSAMNSLNPLDRISTQAWKIAKTHTTWSKEETREQLKELFEVVGLPTSRIDDYPHQFSGGMKQRTVIAMSLLLDPSLVIADEPTTAMDVIMQDQFLKHLDHIREIRDFSLFFITHDIAVVFELCDSMAVMHGGQIAEYGSTADIFDEPRHPYTILLQQAFPDHRYPNRELTEIAGTPPTLRQELDFCTFAGRCPWERHECHTQAPPLEALDGGSDRKVACIRSDEMTTLAASYLDSSPAESKSGRSKPKVSSARDDPPIMEIQNLEKHFDTQVNIVEQLKSKFLGQEQPPVRAVDGVKLELDQNQVQGVIGESGCGKSTLLLTLMGKYGATGGDVLFKGEPLSEFSSADWKEYRRKVQIIFQDPFDTINPQYSVRQALKEPLKVHGMPRDEARLLDTLEQVELTPPKNYIDRSESQLSGGEKQRVSIARALILEPEILLADEPVSMLDVSTQASILRLLNKLTEERDVAMLYISHDLSTVSYVCDRINVMYLGRIVESAPTLELLNHPEHPYTKALLSAIPIPDPHEDRVWTELQGAPGDAQNLPTGCRFKDRCPESMDICEVKPMFREIENNPGHSAACHLLYDHKEAEAVDSMHQDVEVATGGSD